MNNLEIAHWRLYNQQLARQRFSTPGEVVAWMGAMQAQDYSGVKLSIGLRSNTSDAEVDEAIADGAVVRTWPLRGTLHVVAAADVRWMVALIAPRTIAASARRCRELELDDHTFARSNDLLGTALQGGVQRTRTELLTLLEQHGISTRGQRAPYLLQRASLEGLICQGVTTRNIPTYRALDASIAPAVSLPRHEALAALAQRYFTSHGPASLQDFVWWSGLSVGEARAGLAAVQSQFIFETLDGQIYWLHPSTTTPPPDPAALYLLPGFDEYLLGYRDRSAIIEPQHFQKVVPGGNGIFMPFIVIGGRVVGLWKRTLTRGAVSVTSIPFAPLTPAEQLAFAEAAHRYGDFLGLSVSIS